MGTTTIDSEKIKLAVQAEDIALPEEGMIWFKGATEHMPKFHNGTEVKNVGDILETEVDGKITTHAGIADSHHSKYTDAEAQSTVKASVEVGELKSPTQALAMNGQAISGLPAPSSGGDAATKDYADDKVQGLDWQSSVIDELADPPVSPVTGDRYLVIATATGDWVGREDDIAEWDGSAWEFTTPNKGFAVWIEDVGTQKNYNGTAWVAFGSTVDHANLTNVLPDQHHAKYTDAEAQNTVKASVEVGDLKSPTVALAMNNQKITGLAAAAIAGDAIVADADVRAPDAALLAGSTKTEVQTHAPASHDHTGDTLNPTLINVGDIGFKNGYILTEDDEHGLVFVTPKGHIYKALGARVR